MYIFYKYTTLNSLLVLHFSDALKVYCCVRKFLKTTEKQKLRMSSEIKRLRTIAEKELSWVNNILNLLLLCILLLKTVHYITILTFYSSGLIIIPYNS